MNYLDDDRLTFQAMGLLTWMLRHPNIPPTISRLTQASPLGEAGVIAICRQLSTIGYVSKEKRQGPGGKWTYETLVREDLSQSFRLLSAKVDVVTPMPVGSDRKPKTEKERRKWRRQVCNADDHYVIVRTAYKEMLTNKEACAFPVVGNRLGNDESIHEAWLDLVNDGDFSDRMLVEILEGIKTYGHINAVERATQGHCAPIGLYKFLRLRHWEALAQDGQALDKLVKMGVDPTNPRSVQQAERQEAIGNAYNWED
ncbi:MAG: hypothetical protein ACRCT2_01855 [Plesiomonas shigelloides]